MNLLDRLKPEYKEKLTEDCINVLSNYDFVVEMNILDAQLVCYALTGKSIELGILLDLFITP